MTSDDKANRELRNLLARCETNLALREIVPFSNLLMRDMLRAMGEQVDREIGQEARFGGST